MHPFEYIVPSSAPEAVALLAEHGESACPLAGGTDLIVDLKHGPGNINLLVDVSALPEFRGIEETPDGLRIGSMVTFGEIMASPVCRKMTPEIVAAAHTVGAVQTRNLGTVGGNLVTCVPSADIAPSLMVLDARVTVVDPDDRLVCYLGDNHEVASVEGWPNNVNESGDKIRPRVIEPGKFNSPHGIAADAQGNIYVAEWLIGRRHVKLAAS